MNNLDQLDNVLDSIETQKKRAAWRNILDRLEKIEKAHDKGMSYAEMAKLMNITPASFSVALKKAKKYNEQQKQEEQAKKELTKKRVKKISDGNNNFPPVPGSTVKKDNSTGFIDL